MGLLKAKRNRRAKMSRQASGMWLHRFCVFSAVALVVLSCTYILVVTKGIYSCSQFEQSGAAVQLNKPLLDTCGEYGSGLNTAELRMIQQAPIKQKPVYLSACLFAKDERAYLQEWVYHHYLLGFEHFYIYDNNSTDNMKDTVDHLVDLGLVTYIDWVKDWYIGKDRYAAQVDQMKDCWNRSKTDGSRWVLNFDADEFAVTIPMEFNASAFYGQSSFPIHRHLHLAESMHEGVIILDRANFGSNGHKFITPGLQTELYTRRRVNKWAQFIGKPFMHLGHTKQQDNGHLGEATDGWKRVDAVHGNLTDMYHIKYRAVLEPLRLNHYVSRTHEECMAKIPTVSWRAENGQKLCDSYYEGSGIFDWSINTKDTTVAESRIPCLVKSLQQDFGKH